MGQQMNNHHQHVIIQDIIRHRSLLKGVNEELLLFSTFLCQCLNKADVVYPSRYYKFQHYVVMTHKSTGKNVREIVQDFNGSQNVRGMIIQDCTRVTTMDSSIHCF